MNNVFFGRKPGVLHKRFRILPDYTNINEVDKPLKYDIRGNNYRTVSHLPND